MDILNNFEEITETLHEKLDNNEITPNIFMALYEKVYNEAETQLISELHDLVIEGVIDKKEAFEYAFYIDSGYPEINDDVFDIIENTLFEMDENAFLEVDKKVSIGKLTNAERERISNEYIKNKKKIAFKNKLKKVGKAVGKAALVGAAIYGGYKGGKAIGKSLDNGKLGEIRDDVSDKIAANRDKKEDKKFRKLGMYNLRRGNKDYQDLYDKYDADDKELHRNEKKAIKKAKNNYDRDILRKQYDDQRSQNSTRLNRELTERLDKRFGFGKGPSVVEPVLDANGNVDKKATKAKQYEVNRNYREKRKAYRDAISEDERKRADTLDKIDSYKQAEIISATRSPIKKVKDSISRIPNKINNSYQSFDNNIYDKNARNVEKRYKDTYRQV